jgi:hypothetical protein
VGDVGSVGHLEAGGDRFAGYLEGCEFAEALGGSGFAEALKGSNAEGVKARR